MLEFKKPIICELVTDEDQGELFRQDYSLDKNKNRVEAIKLLEAVIKRIPSADNFASDWEWIKKAKVILDDLKS